MTGLRPNPPRARVVLLGAAVVAAVLAVYLFRVDSVAGLIVDDAWYVLLARSLASGERFGMVNSVFDNAVTPYPPGFPLILSIVFRIAPHFPQNVWLLKSVSIAAMVGVGFLAYRYLADQRGLIRQIALISAVAIVLTPAFVFLATSTLMSECVFTFVQLFAVVLLESRRDGVHVRRNTLLAGGAAAMTVLIRSAGIAVVAAGLAYLCYQRQWGRALVFAATVLVCMSPWLWYSSLHAPTKAERLEIGGGHALSYEQNFWLRRASDATSGTVTVAELPARVAANLLHIGVRDVAGVITPTLFRGPTESGMEVIALGDGESPGTMGSAVGTMIVSLALCGLVILGFAIAVRRGVTAAEILVVLSLTIIVLWPFGPYRFFLPLTPFLVLYLVLGIQRLVPPPAVLRIVLLAVVGLQVLDHVQYAAARRAGTTAWEEWGGEVDAVLQWMNGHLTESGHVATGNEPLVYLRTGRRTMASDYETANRQRWKQMYVRYGVYLDRAALPNDSGPSRILYRSPKHRLTVVEY